MPILDAYLGEPNDTSVQLVAAGHVIQIEERAGLTNEQEHGMHAWHLRPVKSVMQSPLRLLPLKRCRLPVRLIHYYPACMGRWSGT